MALYNKYRPMNWASVIGQDAIIKTLQNSVINKQVSSTYLFHGPRGTGKTTMARIFAKALNCESPPAVGDICLDCDNCVSIKNDNSSMVTEMDAASRTGVDDVRELKMDANLVGTGNFKVYIIDEVHMLSKSAQNAALKMFEEAPKNVIFIMCTTELFKLEGTVISRSLKFDFKPIGLDDIISRLEFICKNEEYTADKTALSLIAKSANGGMRDSISILERIAVENSGIVNKDLVMSSLGMLPYEALSGLIGVLSGNLGAGFEIVDKVIGGGSDIHQFFISSVDFVRDLLMIKTGLEKYVVADEDTMAGLRAGAAGLDGARLSRALDILEESLRRMRYAEDSRIFAEVTMCKIAGGQAEAVPVQQVVQIPVQQSVTIPADQSVKMVGETATNVLPPVVDTQPAVGGTSPVITDYDRIRNGWVQYLAGVREKVGENIFFHLKDCTVRSFDNDELVISFINGLTVQCTETQAQADSLGSLLSGLMGKQVRVTVVMDPNVDDPMGGGLPGSGTQSSAAPMQNQPVMQNNAGGAGGGFMPPQQQASEPTPQNQGVSVGAESGTQSSAATMQNSQSSDDWAVVGRWAVNPNRPKAKLGVDSVSDDGDDMLDMIPQGAQGQATQPVMGEADNTPVDKNLLNGKFGFGS